MWNGCLFVLVQIGEFIASVFALLLFVFLRIGPNADVSYVSQGSLDDDKFTRLCLFLAGVIVCEIGTTAMMIRVCIRTFNFDPCCLLSEDITRYAALFTCFPVMIQLPLVMVTLVEHTKTGLQIED